MRNNDPPAQTHSVTSVEAALSIPRFRVLGQERWVYETLRTQQPYADWQLWDMAPRTLFEQATSLHRTRIGLYWRSRKEGITPWHPVEDSGRKLRNPFTGRRCVIWQIKDPYLDMPYDIWRDNYRALARGTHDAATI